jgi:hypothetical protein
MIETAPGAAEDALGDGEVDGGGAAEEEATHPSSDLIGDGALLVVHPAASTSAATPANTGGDWGGDIAAPPM